MSERLRITTYANIDASMICKMLIQMCIKFEYHPLPGTKTLHEYAYIETIGQREQNGEMLNQIRKTDMQGRYEITKIITTEEKCIYGSGKQ